MNRDEVNQLSRYLRSQGYRTRTDRTPEGLVTKAVKRQHDHVQAYVYPVAIADGGQGIGCADFFVQTLHSDGSRWTASNILCTERTRADFWRLGAQGIVDGTGGHDHYGADTYDAAS